MDDMIHQFLEGEAEEGMASLVHVLARFGFLVVVTV